MECTCDAKKLRLTIFDNVLKEITKNINMCGASISEKLACTLQLLTIENDIFASARAMPWYFITCYFYWRLLITTCVPNLFSVHSILSYLIISLCTIMLVSL